MNIIKTMGLDWLLEKDVWQRLDQHICDNVRYVVPGYQYNYRLCTFLGDFEFQRCETLDGDLVNTDMHFSANHAWKLSVSGTLDTSSTAHYHTLISKGGAKIPVRVICPDVLPSIKEGDLLEGQVVAFAESVKKITEAESDGHVVANGYDTVTLNGCITEAYDTDFCFEDQTVEFWELDVNTENGRITILIPCDRIDFSPEDGDYISACGVISMDIALDPAHQTGRDSSFYEDLYEDLIPDADVVNYRNGFVPSYHRNQEVLIASLQSGSIARFARCCHGCMEFTGYNKNQSLFLDRIGLSQAFAEHLPDRIDRIEVKHILSCVEEKYIGHDAVVVYRNGAVYTAICFLVNAKGAVYELECFNGSQCEVGLDYEFHLHAMLAQAMCDATAYILYDYLDAGCMYRSEYADRCVVGAKNIIQRLEEIDENLNGEKAYTFRHALAKDELIDEDDLALIYRGKHCTVNYFKGELAYIIFLMYNEEHKITNILLSRNPTYLHAFKGKGVETRPAEQVKSVIEILSAEYGSTDTVQSMRKNDIPAIDENEVYIWKKTDEFAIGWLREQDYRIFDTALLDDCIGYACERKGVQYACFFYAYGEERTTQLDGDYCAKLRDTEFGQGREILIIYLHVTKSTNDAGETEYTVGSYGREGHEIEPWLLTEVMGKSILRYYPRKEMMDLLPRLMSAFNAKNLDALKVICAKDVCLETYERDGSRSMNDGFYSHLSYIREHHGVMKTAYIRFNDVVFSAVPYIDGYAYIGFSANGENRIDGIRVHPLNDTYRELLITDELLTDLPANKAPKLVSVDFLPPSEISRYSLRAVFENGEIRRYDLDEDFGEDEITQYQHKIMTDKIFANGRIIDHIPLPDWMGYRNYAKRGQGVAFINGTSISALEIYDRGYPIEKFSYQGMDVFIRQSDYDERGFAVGHIPNLDPQNPDYLLDKNTMMAMVIPEKYQQTPVGIYPVYGGCSEGLVMVSEMGEVDLQYYHNRGPCAGLWGWLDTSLNVVIAPKYVYAMNFWNGRAIVCRGEWNTKTTENGRKQYWCENEQWGVIDRHENQIVPCRFDEIFEIDGTDRLYFVHEGGWENGHYAAYDIKENAIILVLDFDFDMGYMFNECAVTDDHILVFDEHIPGEEKDLIYAYDLVGKTWIAHGDELIGRTLNGETRSVIEKDGKDIIVF